MAETQETKWNRLMFHVTKLYFFSPLLQHHVLYESKKRDGDGKGRFTVAGETRVACVKFGVESSILFCL
jgi:hypothetical protein